MKHKNNDFCSGNILTEQLIEDSINTFGNEWTTLEYYNDVRGFEKNEIKCRCLNQNLITEADFCELCNAHIY